MKIKTRRDSACFVEPNYSPVPLLEGNPDVKHHSLNKDSAIPYEYYLGLAPLPRKNLDTKNHSSNENYQGLNPVRAKITHQQNLPADKTNESYEDCAVLMNKNLLSLKKVRKGVQCISKDSNFATIKRICKKIDMLLNRINAREQKKS
ncbi:hypothetical protein Glove_109g269 [Diversispora epigaea]|uniref:Uncharacterized protein n=1 Tax=Diversispora epigaea TaxID=1348612 RepID=A0A397J6R0_9GLOM|nr:hypothetical protein Glove_109g269 [Diversispora epigaea]